MLARLSLAQHISTLDTDACTAFPGCVYNYDATHPIGGRGFTETDAPNFAGSTYSRTKAAVDSLAAAYPNVLLLRMRMPLTADWSDRNIVVKYVGWWGSVL